MERRVAPADLLVGLGVCALGLTILWYTGDIPERLFTQLGPRAAPYLAGGALVLLGIALTIDGARGRWTSTLDADDAPVRLGPVGWLLAGLAVNVLVIGGIANVPLVGRLVGDTPPEAEWARALVMDGLGFVPAATLQFVLIARAFGSRRVLRDAAIGLAVTLVSLLGFGRGFGVNIGNGIVDVWVLRRFDGLLALVGIGG